MLVVGLGEKSMHLSGKLVGKSTLKEEGMSRQDAARGSSVAFVTGLFHP